MIKKLLLILLIISITSPCLALTEQYCDCGDGGSGDGSAGDPWATLQEAFDEVSADERINVLSSTECDIAARIDIDVTSGTADTPIIVQGYTSSAGDGGIGVIDGQSNAIDCINVAEQHYIFKDLEIKNCDQDGLDISANGDNTAIQSVYINNMGDKCIEIDANSSNNKVIGCELASCTGDILGADTGSQVISSYLHNGSIRGIDQGTGSLTAINNIINTTADHGIYIASGDNSLLVHNTVYNTTGADDDNLNIGGTSERNILVNNLFNVANDDQIEVAAGGNIMFNLHSNMYDGGAGTKSGTITFTIGESTTNPSLNTSTFAIGSALDDLGYPTYFDSTSGGTTVVNHAEMGAIPYEETASGGGEYSFGFSQ